MAANILLDYSFKFSEVTGVQKADLSYLKNIAIIVKSKTPGGTSPTTQEITKATDAAQYTDAKYLDGIFAGGMNIIKLIICDALDDAKTAMDSTSEFTTLIDDAWTSSEIKSFDPSGYDGVVGAVFGAKSDAEAYVADKNRTAFLDAALPKAYGMYYAFGAMVSGAYWRAKQYLQVVSTNVSTENDLGDAEDLFSKKISFYLGDDQYGKRLGFFGCGGGSGDITAPYISEEIKRIVQSTGVNYLALNEPRNISISRIRLEDALQDKIDEYKLPPYQYLDPEGSNEITLTASNTAFTLNGQLSIKIAEPIWRVAVEARQEV